MLMVFPAGRHQLPLLGWSCPVPITLPTHVVLVPVLTLSSYPANLPYRPSLPNAAGLVPPRRGQLPPL